MSDQTVRAEIKARLDALGPAIGRVHDYERWTNSNSEFLSLFKDETSQKIFGWEIKRTAVRVEKAAMRKWKLIHTYVLKGYYALKDGAATEKLFNAVIDTIVLDFTRTKIAGTDKPILPRAEPIQERIFGRVLCHTTQIRLNDVIEIVAELPEEGETDLLSIGMEYFLQDPEDDGVADATDELTFTP